MFCPAKVSVATLNELVTLLIMLSIFTDAVFPAIAAEPKEFIAEVIIRFVIG